MGNNGIKWEYLYYFYNPNRITDYDNLYWGLQLQT
jgi:hypothetical protein